MSKHDHPLVRWATRDGRKLMWLASASGISQSSLREYITGRRPAPMPVKLVFQTITDGEVKAEDWPEVGK